MHKLTKNWVPSVTESDVKIEFFERTLSIFCIILLAKDISQFLAFIVLYMDVF